ncbi:simple sugar transport system ATP-binding protein [Amaricoccus macauensis]|jgi:simple sugar transport system ATP-binding protein|uniref:Simple sugar transport system ATP-binding protein n=1 Tax=Amaricoccus macauensis TaxID=57001 RepID=A0A840SL35_9RHOB|nr:ATP-binding cassette domain-containing protein [Amaricoccus macauensis]MBB5220858.1 simple sugar transport system ATP-binding protein [Amaricoccus macauensis]
MSETLLEVRNLSKHFGAIRALDNFDMTIHRGEVVALAGDNGAGKTTMIKTISGVFRPTSGEVILRGEPVSFSTPQEARDKGIETIYQDLALADNLSIGANIFLGREPMTKKWGFLPVLDRKTMREAARETMALLDFHVSRLDAPVSNFSGGQRQAVAIGRAVHWNAQILIMDEPTAALGVPEQRKVLSLIRQLKAQGRGIIFISHNLQDIFAVSDRIIVMRRGIKAGERAISETTHDEVVKLMIGG